MTEDEARQVLLVQALETQGTGRNAWSTEDRRWATRQAVATVGEDAGPERFVVARAVLALQRLLPRDAAAQRWLHRRAWHPAWAAVAVVLGLVFGLLVDQLGPPQRVNLLAPAVWAVVAWNLVVYLALMLPSPKGSLRGLRAMLARWWQPAPDSVATLWAEHAAPLTLQRVALVLHAAAAALALGLIAGLYLRGLVLDYRAGWQSTFLDAPTVQQALAWLLAPARWITGIAIPDVAPLRVSPGADATATAAPWIHLLAATLALAVVLPRTLLALWAAARAAHRSEHFALPLDTPYFEALHPLMRPGLPRAVRVLWVAPPDLMLRLFDTDVGAVDEVLTVLRSDEGDELQLQPVPPNLDALQAPAQLPAGWWRTLWAPADPAAGALARLRACTDLVLLITRPGALRPAWLSGLQRPLVVLVDGPQAEPPALTLQARHEGWLSEGRLLQALQAELPDDPRLLRLRQAWGARQQARLDAGVQIVADGLAHIAAAHAPVADEGFLARRAEAEAARNALTAALDVQWRACDAQLVAFAGADTTDPAQALAAPTAALRQRVGEGRAALVGGALTGALAGLKADVLSGGLTMGAGLVAGGLIGALGAAGVARGLNVVRGTDKPFAAWSDEALAPIVQALLMRYLALVHALPPDQAQAPLAAALAQQQALLATLWRSRERRLLNTGEAERLAQALHPVLSRIVRQALGGP